MALPFIDMRVTARREDMKTMQLGVTSISKRVTKVEQLGDGNGLAGSWSYMRSHLTSYAATLGREGGDTTL